MPQADPDPVVTLDGRLDGGLLLLCDHACNALPARYGDLGLPAAEFERHIAYDIGAAAATRRMAEILGVPALLTTYSRLLIDPNRGARDPTLVMRVSDGAIVPGNARIDEAEIEHRRRTYWQPYRDGIDAMLDRMLATGTVPAVVAMHSFTPVMKGIARPWHIGLLWDADARLAHPLLEALAAEPDLQPPRALIGDNEPYDGALPGDTMDSHATRRGLANVLIEVRQDLMATEADAHAWGERLARLLAPILARPDVRRVTHHPSRAGHAPTPLHRRSHPMTTLDDATRTTLEAAAFRRLIGHLRERTDVQNIDLMNLAGFCRNCLSNWLEDAARDQGVPLSRDEARQHVYGMPYAEWKAHHQAEASPAQAAAFATSHVQAPETSQT